MKNKFATDVENPAAAAGAPAAGANEKRLAAHAALLAELESSLRSSQQALLRRDREGLERETQEQRRIHRALSDQAEPERNLIDPSAPARARILHLARVQSALLRRAQRSLVVLAHLLAGAGSSYAPEENARNAAPSTPRNPKGAARSCRA